MRYLVVAFFGALGFLLVIWHANGKPADRADRSVEEDLMASLQGVWEQIGLQRENERIEEIDPGQFAFLKTVKVIVGKNAYTSAGRLLGAVFSEQAINVAKLGMPASIDFVSTDDNRTVRTLTEVKGDTLKICYHLGSKTLIRPEQIAATPDFEFQIFKRLPAPKTRNPNDNTGKRLAGVWRAVEVEYDGEKINEQNRDIEKKENFWKEQRSYYFQDGIYTMRSAVDQDHIVTRKPYLIVPEKGKHAIDFTNRDDSVLPALYEMQGDRLVFCWAKDGQTRPDGFRTEKDDGLIVIRLERLDRATPTDK